MCGIWAFLQTKSKGRAAHTENGKEERGKEEHILDQFHDFLQLKHRGPDHTHFETYGPITFGFHRLAIVDTSFAGNQPFKKEDEQRTVFLLCNGEIYNYKELIEEFQLGAGIKNDCCALLEIYWKLLRNGCEADFPKVIQRSVKGEYAFLLVEMDALKNVRQVIACRDAVGVRPLYCSTVSAIQAGHGLLFTSEIKGAESYPGDIKEFPPGHLMYYRVDMFGDVSVDNHSLTGLLYAYSFDGDVKDDRERLYDLRQTVVDCVQRRLSADRPIAFLTSGGIDSSLVTALSAKLLGKPIRTFCCGITEGGVAVGRDLEYAREVAEWIGSEHTEVLFTKEEALAAIPDVVRTVESWDTTTVRASVGQYLVCRWIGQNTDCRVVLVGEGPDEVCSSYLFNWYAPNGEALDQSARDYVKKIHLYDARRADRCIARWGLEARVPFLDPEFIQTYWSIPAEERMPKTRGIEKWWLREAFKDTGVLPERVRLRMKDAFSDSISGQISWTQIIQEWVANKVSDEEMAAAGETYPWCTPQTKEAYYYRKLFCEFHGEKRQGILPGYWQPRWNADGVEVSGYVDPSARTLGVYSSLNQS
jgi:asparagine synthase (glutamine-hydrolysing)